jgi:hypothetical protein
MDGVDYNLDDDVVCYFCFSRLGLVVALKPGDFLLIHALEYHCLSSRCDSDHNLFCVSSYLKTVIVGGNDNKRQLSVKEVKCMKAFDDANLSLKKTYHQIKNNIY